MDILLLILRYVHLLGFAMLFGGWLTAYLKGQFKVNSPMLWGSATQLITGIVLAAPLGRDSADQPDPVKLAVKAVLAILIAVMVWVPHLKKRESSAKAHFAATGGLIAITAGVAVFWT